MNTEEAAKQLREKLSGAQKILVGIGSEWRAKSEEEAEEIREAGEILKNLLDGRDYYVLTTLTGADLERLPFEKTHRAAPMDVSCTEEEWKAYTLWLSCTLNRETVLLELGENYMNPSVIRWPFEKTALINQKACLFRIHRTFSQIPDELKGKAVPVAASSVDFLRTGAFNRA